MGGRDRPDHRPPGVVPRGAHPPTDAVPAAGAAGAVSALVARGEDALLLAAGDRALEGADSARVHLADQCTDRAEPRGREPPDPALTRGSPPTPSWPGLGSRQRGIRDALLGAVLSPGPLRRWAGVPAGERSCCWAPTLRRPRGPALRRRQRRAIAPSAAWLSLAAAALNPAATPRKGLFPFLKELGAVLQDTVPISLRPGPLAATVALVDSLCRGRGTTLPSEY